MHRNNGKVFQFSYPEFIESVKSVFFLVGLFLGCMVWIIDPFIDVFILNEGILIQQLVNPDTKEIYFRSVISIIIILFSFAGALLLIRARSADNKIKHYGQAFEDSLNEIYLINAETLKFVEANNAALRNLGYTLDELQDMTFLDLSPGSTLESFENLVMPLRNKEKKKIVCNTVHKRKDNSVYHVEAHLQLLEHDNKTFFVVILMDITDRKQVDEDLHSSQERLQAIYDQSNDAIFLLDVEQNKILDFNQKALMILGYLPEELQDAPISMIHPDEMDKLNAFSQSVLNHGGFVTDELTCLTKFKAKVPVEISASYIHIKDKSYMLAVVRDISERKLSDDRIKRYSRIFENSLNEVYLIDANTHKFVEVNNAAMKNLGYTMEELRAMTPLDLNPKLTNESFLELVDPLKKNEEKIIVFETVHKRKDKSIYDVEAHLQQLKHDNETLFVVILIDITERKRSEKLLTYQATHDVLTGLVNRREFETRAKKLLMSVKQEKVSHALCFMDLDQFKVVNDTCGHTAGDELLRQLSSLLQEKIRHQDLLARLGGDEFGILMEYCSLDDAYRVATTLQKAIQQFQFIWEGQSFRIGVSIGLVSINEKTHNMTELLKNADTACYVAKDRGRNRIHVYHDEDSEIAQRHGEMQWVSLIHQALEEDRFCLYAQPIVALDGSTNVHYELLIRMKNEKGEIILPGEFLPAAEHYNLITLIDNYVINSALKLLIENPHFLEQIDYISINLSGKSLADERFLNSVIMELQDKPAIGEKICFEITETAVITNLNIAINFINKMRLLGCRFALDDFGSGLSSFAYLKNLKVDYLKIDGMFVKDIAVDPIDHAMVKSINDIGQVMGMKTIAEFVDNDIILGMLKEIGINSAQGYGTGKPLPLDKIITRQITPKNKILDQVN